MAFSGTYDFLSPQNVQMITDAFERIGIQPGLLDDEKIQSAIRSLNFIQTSWMNRGLNLWTVRQEMLALTPGQTSYYLPLTTVAVLEATLRQSTRNLGGTPTSSSGVAANAFDNNPATACTQTAPDGFIAYNWGAGQYAISMVGIQSNASLTYTITCEYSNDGVTWFNARNIPEQLYTIDITQWFVIPVPRFAKRFRIRETGGATLNIQELYFNTFVQDTIISPISRAEWVALPQKTQAGRPSSFYLDRQIVPVLNIWPAPIQIYNNLFYTRTVYMEDLGSLLNSQEIPATFLEPMCSALAHRLHLKYGNDLAKTNYLKTINDEEMRMAMDENRERVPLRIYGDYMNGWTM